jgi:predicted ATPase/DNA-binding SARP family transcriptional activator
MRFCVLGPVLVTSGQHRLDLGSERQRTILALLLAAGGDPVSRDRLALGLWGDEPPPSAATSLRSHLSRLRRALAGLDPAAATALASEGGTCRLHLRGEELDSTELEDLANGARRVRHEDPHGALARAEQALALWRGPAFGDLAHHELIHPEAARLEHLRSEVAALRVECLLELGRSQEALSELEAQVRDHPTDEHARARLMVALYRAGRQVDALATYLDLERELGESLGIHPSPELRRIHARILRQDPGLEERPARRPAGGSPSPAAPRMTQGSVLLPRRGDLVGRDDDVAAVGALVTSTRLVTLTGPGGVGKTRLALEVAASVSDRFRDGARVCQLAQVHDPAGVTATVLGAVGLQHLPRTTDPETAASNLAAFELVLVLDGCEHVLGVAATQVEAIVVRCPRIHVLATSREHLHLSEERVWQVAPLAVPRPGGGRAELLGSPAGRLLIQRARAVAGTGDPSDGDVPALVELCGRLDGLPLAIELAAARLRAFPPAVLLDKLTDRFEVLTGGPSHHGGRHRTLEAMVDWSYQLLPAQHSRAFERLSSFVGAFDLAAAEVVAAADHRERAAIPGILADLVDRSMVQVEHTELGTRYRLLDTLRAYGARALAASGHEVDCRATHAAHHLDVAERLGALVRGPNEPDALARIDAAFDDLRLAHEWLVEVRDVDGALGLPAALHDHLHARLRDEVVEWARRAVALPGASGHPLHAAALATAAWGALNRGEPERARTEAETALAGAVHDPLAAVRALDTLQALALFEGRSGEVLARVPQQLALAERLGDPYYRALAELFRLLALLYGGQQQAALDQSSVLLAAADASGNQTMRAWARYGQGEVLLEADPARARQPLEEAVQLARRSGARLPEGTAMLSLATACARSGETKRALALFRDAVAHWRSTGDWAHQLTTLRNLVEVLLDAGADDDAAMLHGAVQDPRVPSFGPEASRLAAAWDRLEARLGPVATRRAAEHGAQLSETELADVALARLDALVA